MKKSYKLIKTFVVLLCIATFKLAAQPLSGLYTINAAQATGGTNFQTFNAFVTALTTTAGVSGSGHHRRLCFQCRRSLAGHAMGQAVHPHTYRQIYLQQCQKSV